MWKFATCTASSETYYEFFRNHEKTQPKIKLCLVIIFKRGLKIVKMWAYTNSSISDWFIWMYFFLYFGQNITKGRKNFEIKWLQSCFIHFEINWFKTLICFFCEHKSSTFKVKFYKKSIFLVELCILVFVPKGKTIN